MGGKEGKGEGGEVTCGCFFLLIPCSIILHLEKREQAHREEGGGGKGKGMVDRKQFFQSHRGGEEREFNSSVLRGTSRGGEKGKGGNNGSRDF